MVWVKLKTKSHGWVNQYARMYTEMKYTDMIILAGEDGKVLKCHRSVLAACSPVFDQMFASSMVEGVGVALDLRHVCSTAVQVLLKSIYVPQFCSENFYCHGQTVLPPRLLHAHICQGHSRGPVVPRRHVAVQPVHLRTRSA